jgi:hypothetical protein
MADRMFTAYQVQTAQRELREAAGTDAQGISSAPIEAIDEPFSLRQTIVLLSPEILVLRERGFTDDRIAALLTGFEIEATTKQVGDFYTAPATGRGTSR